MPATPIKTSQTVWAAKWEHKHGEDISLHTTEEGARKQLVAWARETLAEWHIDGKQYSSLDVCGEEHPTFDDDALIKAWPELTGETEFLCVEDHVLHGPDIWDEPKDEPKKKTWKQLFPESTLKPNADGHMLLYTGMHGLSPEVIDKLREDAPYFQELGYGGDGELIIHTGQSRDSIKSIDVFEIEKD